jgi:hypothetical protein
MTNQSLFFGFTLIELMIPHPIDELFGSPLHSVWHSARAI